MEQIQKSRWNYKCELVALSHVGKTKTDTIITCAMRATVMHSDRVQTGVLKARIPLSQMTSVE